MKIMQIVDANQDLAEDVNTLVYEDIEGGFAENAKRVKLNEEILSVMPDIKLSMRALTSMVRSPTGSNITGLVFNADDELFSPDIRSMLLNTIKKEIKRHYKLDDLTKSIINNVLFKYGSDCFIIIPDMAIEDFIISNSVGTESCKLRSLNGDRENLLLPITDDKSNLIVSHHNISVGMEARAKKIDSDEDREFELLIRAMNDSRPVPRVDMKTIDDFVRSESSLTGRPLVLNVDPSAILPLASKSDPSLHMGYFCMVDDYGNIVNEVDTVSNAGQTNTEFDKLRSLLFPDEMAKHVKTDVSLEIMQAEYNSKVTKEIERYMSNKEFHGISRVDDYNFILETSFRRALAGLKTRLIYLDRSNVVYYADQYRKDGVGKSKLEDISVILSMRAMLTFATIKGSIANNIPKTMANIKLDDKDPNPIATMKSVIDLIMKSKADSLPIGMLDPASIANWLHKASIFTVFSHKDLPDITIDMEEKKGEKVLPDTELIDMLKDFSIRALGLPPELIENVDGVNFATTITTMQSLMADTIDELQISFNRGFTKHIKTIVENDSFIKDKLIAILTSKNRKLIKSIGEEYKKPIMAYKEKNGDKFYSKMIDLFIENIVITLPKTPSVDEEVSKANFDDYMAKLSDAIDLYVSSDTYDNEEFGDIDADMIKSMMMSSLGRKWMLDNNYLPDLTDAITRDERGDPKLNMIETHQEILGAISRSLKPFLVEILKSRERTDLTKIEEELNKKKKSSDNVDPEKTSKEKETAKPDEGEPDVKLTDKDKFDIESELDL